MGRVKEFYHEEICEANEVAINDSESEFDNLPAAEELLKRDLVNNEYRDLFSQYLPSWMHNMYR